MGTFWGPRGSGGGAQRDSWTTVPPIPPNSANFGGSLNTATSYSGSLNSGTSSAGRRVAIGSSVRLLAGVTASLPLDCFTGEGEAKRKVPLPPFFRDPDGLGQGIGDWLEQLIWSAALRGNGFGHILHRDPYGRADQVLLKHPDAVGVQQGPNGPVWRFNGAEVDRDEVWHRRMFPVPGHILGMSVIAQHATTILQGEAATQFGLQWFLDGGHPSAILQNTDSTTIDQSLAASVKAKFLAAVRGTREPVVLGSGWEYKAIQVAANESQFLDTMKYSEAECARIFGPGMAEVLGYPTGGSLTYANVEQRALDLLKFTLNTWFTKVENWLSWDFCPRPQYVKFNRGALLETDLLTRYKAYEIGIRNKFLVPNEPREKEDLPPLAGGDEPTSTPTQAPAPVTVED